MNIEMIKASEIEEVKKLADSLLVKPNELYKIYGFYDYSLTLDQYINRSESPFFLVAKSPSDLEGFCMAYDSEFVKMLRQKEPEINRDAIFEYLSELDDYYVYIDQFAVRKPQRSLGRGNVSYNLMEILIEKTKNSNMPMILAAIPHKPWKNNVAIRFVTKFQFDVEQELSTEKNIVLGIYKLIID